MASDTHTAEPDRTERQLPLPHDKAGWQLRLEHALRPWYGANRMARGL